MQRSILAISSLAALAACAHALKAEPVTDIWNSVALPAAPELVPVTVDPRKAALLVLDMYPTSCNLEMRPSCPATIAPIARLLSLARANGMLVVYGAGPVANAGPTDPVPELARRAEEPLVRGPADKFFGSDLAAILAARNIEQVIITGTSADGAVLNTASSASLRGFKTIVPIDAMSSKERFAELYTAYHLKNSSASVTRNITLTSTDRIAFP